MNEDTLPATWIDCEDNWEQTKQYIFSVGVNHADKTFAVAHTELYNHNPVKMESKFHDFMLNLILDVPLDSFLRRKVGGYLKSKKLFSGITSTAYYRKQDVEIFRLANVHDLDGEKQVLMAVQVRCSDQQSDEEDIRHKIFLKPEKAKLLKRYMEIQ